MRRSKIAENFLANSGDTALRYVHTLLELANFSAGNGTGAYSLPYHAIGMQERTGDSKRSIGWYGTLQDAIDAIRNRQTMDNGADTARGGADTLRRDMATYYVRDIRNGKIYKA